MNARDLLGFQEWAENFSMRDDGPVAYAAIKSLQEIRTEMIVQEEGWVDRVREILG